ncbi:hypothetical protein OUY22_35615 [Nonomuraea sp. MCN248]|uniref:MmyB-like transcription regulator ligand binding domain-containing protein n=1 Tax=Nonomuraea corallina TaxID=2989783 RepID=A0ABT4SNE5_9ACTN|nr:hypothetical protein [Nonomuraea corallina]MDA0638768.1 hypothetical protein [Nonomuraea corallina]
MGLFQHGNRDGVVISYDLMETPDPEQRLRLTADVFDLSVKFGRALEQSQLTRVLLSVAQEPRVGDTTPSKGKVRLHRVKLPLGNRHRVDVTPEDCSFV